MLLESCYVYYVVSEQWFVPYETFLSKGFSYVLLQNAYMYNSKLKCDVTNMYINRNLSPDLENTYTKFYFFVQFRQYDSFCLVCLRSSLLVDLRINL